jgi:hypothetical protein
MSAGITCPHVYALNVATVNIVASKQNASEYTIFNDAKIRELKFLTEWHLKSSIGISKIYPY